VQAAQALEGLFGNDEDTALGAVAVYARHDNKDIQIEYRSLE
jgi:hypothetical protein